VALVSVVVPAYNSATTLDATLRSIADQTMRDLTVMVIDDGSSDDTVDVAEAFASGDRRFSVLTKKNGGAAAARNTGLAAARGEFVAFLDSDDLWLPGKLDSQLAVFRARPEVGVSQTGVIHADTRLQPLFVERCTPGPMDPMEVLRFRNLPGFASTVMIRRSSVPLLGEFDAGLAILEDWEFALRATIRSVLWSIAEPLSIYRAHPGNRSRDLDLHIEPGMTVLDRLFADPELDPSVRRGRNEAYARMYLMFAGGAFRVGRWGALLRWGVKALVTDPRMVGYMAALPLRRLQRRLSRRTSPSLPSAPTGLR
jgi:glycosyltransferase involved in cell wall biosynthesis